MIKSLDTFPPASSLFGIFVSVCSSQVSAPDLDIMHGTLLSVYTNTRISLIAVMPWSTCPDLPPQLQDAGDVLLLLHRTDMDVADPWWHLNCTSMLKQQNQAPKSGERFSTGAADEVSRIWVFSPLW